MMTKWTSKAFPNGDGAGSAPGEEAAVLLLYGKNSFGDKIYSYLKLTLPNMQGLKLAVKAGKGFNPSDFGEVLAAGKGEPSGEVRAEMAALYKVLDSQSVTRGDAGAIIEKKAWDEY